MKTKKEAPEIFLVLVPHRDVRQELRKFRPDALPEAGVYSFPYAAPLAALSCPLNQAELKNCARLIKETILGADDGKFKITETSSVLFPACKDHPALFGTRLYPDIAKNIAGYVNDKLIDVFSHSVIGCFLLPKDINGQTDFFKIPPASALSFRAAAVANMFFSPYKQNSYKWKIGQLCWLPKKV